jgi:transcriptional antiterminator NusG
LIPLVPMSAQTYTDHKWYAVQCLSNHEDKVKRYLCKYKEENEEFSQCLNEILVPIETVSEVKNGKKRQRDRKFYPGYVFVEMKLFDTQVKLLKKPWYKVKETDGVINFIGRENPTPLGDEEIRRILKQVDDAKGKEVPKVKFGKGEVVKILDGPFLNLTGEIEDIDAERGTLKVSVSIFGRFTPVELEFWQVEKADEE